MKKLCYYCPDCNKVFDDNGTKVCAAYLHPEEKWRLGCALASNKINIETEKKKIRVGQQKQKRHSWR